MYASSVSVRGPTPSGPLQRQGTSLARRGFLQHPGAPRVQLRRTLSAAPPRGMAYAASAPKLCAAAVHPQAASPEVISALLDAQAVAFDVDSTLCTDESIDELAAFIGVGQEVADLTTRAMGGSVSFRDALTDRLNVMQVSSTDMQRFLESHPPQITPGIPELVKQLHAKGKQVYLVSGGFRQIINPVADMLNIPRENVFANQILYKEDGSYAGFDTAEFTSSSGGKPAALRHIKEKSGIDTIVMVGDGATDLEARTEGVAELFIGYGGAVWRQNVAEAADWYITSFDDMMAILK